MLAIYRKEILQYFFTILNYKPSMLIWVSNLIS